MLSTIFIILMFAVVVDFFWLAIKLAWSVGKLILSFIINISTSLSHGFVA